MKGDYQISFSKAENIEMPRFHYHDHYEIYYLFGGERYYYIENRTYHVKKGSMIFIKKNDIHKTLLGGKHHERTVIYFTDRLLEPRHDRHLDLLLSPFHHPNRIVEFNPMEQNYIENLIFQMKNEYVEEGRQGRDLYFESLLVQLLLYAHRKLTEASEVAYVPMNKNIMEVIDYCNSHYRKPLTMEGVSARFYISPFHFSRLFKRYTGFNFPEYINTLRIREAQKLLRETPYKVIEIAERVGYMNITHFNRKFKQVASMSPLEYKKMIKASSNGHGTDAK
ncbi:AraC family transcriptional regulator [Paenibacillus sp. GD4]|uniref:helix-turn-helix transcriptional regulator n=1 Tax=Paenibacillus sp. GD4 TaxID=3068890 RepID=UPI002796B5AF|nr:AraC family transcriptional regulator [Paenibacillus sp. GD4]MDQ1913227.1 AraC family transcriptional regulator [Paenibacillus sp. GD4]